MLAFGPEVEARSISLFWSRVGFISGSASMGGRWSPGFLLPVGAGQHAARVKGIKGWGKEESAPNHFILHPKESCGSLLAAAFSLFHVQHIPQSLPLGSGCCSSPGALRGDKVSPPCTSHCPASGHSTRLPQPPVNVTPWPRPPHDITAFGCPDFIPRSQKWVL